MRPTCILALAALLLTACTSSKFRPYQGAQQEWPTSPGGFAETIEGIPVYDGLPPKPYDIVGQVQLERRTWLAPSTRRKAALVAKEQGADGVVVLDEGTRLIGFHNSATGTISPTGNSLQYSGSGNSQAQYAQTARVYLIKFR